MGGGLYSEAGFFEVVDVDVDAPGVELGGVEDLE